jgi:glycosyltransferase involved in cell wall biosynthesis
MAAGCPVVASDAGSLAEVVGDAALTGDCRDHAGLAAHCERLLTDAALRERQVQAGRRRVATFHPQCLAERMVEQYRVVASRRCFGDALD